MKLPARCAADSTERRTSSGYGEKRGYVINRQSDARCSNALAGLEGGGAGVMAQQLVSARSTMRVVADMASAYRLFDSVAVTLSIIEFRHLTKYRQPAAILWVNASNPVLRS